MSAAPPRFDRLRAPGEEDARRRALAVARAALAERPPASLARPLRSRALVVASLAAVVAALILAIGLTAPGRATAQWVGNHLSQLTGHAPHPAPPPRAASPYAPLPGGGRLLAVNDQGLFAFGLGAAPRELLGRIDDAAWSPHGRFAAAARGIELIAVDVHGRRHWSHAEEGPIRWPAWSPSGFRVAYVVGSHATGGRAIHVIAGDGTNPRLLTASGPTRPVWQPGVAPAERLATVDQASRVTLRDADSGHVIWRARMFRAPRALAWAPDGRRLFVLTRDRVIVLDGATGRRLSQTPRQTETINIRIAARPGGHHGYAVIRRRVAPPAQAEVAVTRTQASGRALDTTSVLLAAGTLRAIAWSPRGDWLAAEQAGVDGWDLVHLRGRSVDRARSLGAGRGARLAGWCCG